ncbi:MAG: hypothetical protein II670_10850 [Alphaproteobacteria bacterium]|nr:hypothetical protein [Alphaproteobacteria bacterium]
MSIGLAILLIIGLVLVGLVITGLITGWGKAEITNEDIRDFVFFNAFMNQIHYHFDSNGDNYSIF